MSGTKGHSGWRKKPDYLKMVQGTLRKDRIKKEQPQPKRALPEPFGRLSRGERKEFDRLCKILGNMGILTEADAIAVSMLSRSLCSYHEASREVQKLGFILERKAKNGEVLKYKNPWLRIMFDELKFINSMLPKFGLDPSSRSSLRIEIPANSPSIYDDIKNGHFRLVITSKSHQGYECVGVVYIFLIPNII